FNSNWQCLHFAVCTLRHLHISRLIFEELLGSTLDSGFDLLLRLCCCMVPLICIIPGSATTRFLWQPREHGTTYHRHSPCIHHYTSLQASAEGRALRAIFRRQMMFFDSNTRLSLFNLFCFCDRC